MVSVPEVGAGAGVGVGVGVDVWLGATAVPWTFNLTEETIPLLLKIVIVALLAPADPGVYLTFSEMVCPGPSVTGKDGDAI